MWRIELAAPRFAPLSLFLFGAGLFYDGHGAWAQSVQSPGQQVPNSSTKMPTRALLQAATGDPFSPFLAAAPSIQKQKRAEAAVVTPLPIAAPIVQPSLPPVDLTFLGRMGSGQEVQVFAMHQGQTVLLQAGEALPNGFVVQSVGVREVQLRHASLDQITRWPLPAAPIFETR